MASSKSAATESTKRKRGLDIGDLKKLFDTEPDDYKIAWNELKHRIIEFNDHARQTVPSVNSTCIIGVIRLTSIACAVDSLSS